MSLERAYINCLRCFGLTRLYYVGGKLDEKDIIKDDKIFSARNEAMRALEEEVSRHITWEEGIELAKKALKACTQCHYQKTSIANVIDER